MTRMRAVGIALCAMIAAGCVSTETHTRTMGQLESERKAKAAMQAELEELKRRLTDADQARAKVAEDLAVAQARLDSSSQNLAALQKSLYEERDGRRGLEGKLDRLSADLRKAEQVNADLRRDRDHLQTKVDDLQREVGEQGRALAGANARIEALEKEKNELAASVTEARDQARDLRAKLDAELAQVASLQDDKQRLLSGTSTAQEEIAKLQRRAGELESASARTTDLEQRLAERDQEIGQLRQAASDRDTLAAKVAALSEKLEHSQARVAALTDESGQLGAERDELGRERGRLAAQVEQLKEEKQRLTQTEQELLAKLQQEQDRLKSEEAEKARLEKERAAKEEEIRRLTRAQEELSKSLQDEIAKGNITIQRVRDRLTINMVDKVLFDSGRADIKPAGLKVLKQVGDIVGNVPNKQIRIEGHTDNVPIGARIKDRFASNWELSTARATSVVRYLIDAGGIDRQVISAAGYADTRPVADNETDEGKASNRRIEIVLYPKDLKEIAKEFRADTR